MKIPRLYPKAVVPVRPFAGACLEAMENRLFLSAVAHHPAAKPPVKAVPKAAVKVPVSSGAHPKITKKAPVVQQTRKKPAVKVTPAAVAYPGAIVTGNPAASPGASPNAATAPFTPSEIDQFYSINSISFNGTSGTGAGETIAVIDAYSDPKFVSSSSSNFDTSDLHVFDQNYGLPDPPSFSVIPQAGDTSLPTGYDSGWAIETALDVEWAHAIAPQANIILVECDSNSDSDLITNGVQAAISAGANVVSMSFTGDEAPGYNSSFKNTSNVTFLASTGDQGVSSTGYPSLSPYVVAVGGTSITTSDAAGDYGSEVVWNTSSSDNDATGGGIASIESKPSYQASETLSGTYRGVPDVSFDADPYTGVYVLDTSQSGGGGYYKVGGTSLSSPCWAGLIAIADQGRAIDGQSALGGYSTTLPRLYALPSSVFNDITSGNNTDTNESPTPGYSAGPGYDLASGIGTPIANTLVPDLAGVGTITGRVFVDNSGNGIYGGSDTPLAGKTVYLDLNNNGIQDSNEPTAVTDSAGIYTFTNQPAGGTVRLAASIPGYVAISPSSATIAYGITDTINLTYFPIAFSTTTPATTYTVQTDATNTNEQILVNGSLMYSVARSVLGASTLSFSLTGAGDSLTLNATNSSPAVAGIILAGASGGDPLTVIGTASGNDAFVVASNSISFNAVPVNFSNVSLLTLNPGSGTDSLVVSSGSVSIATPAAGQGILTRNFSNLNVSSGATTAFVTAPAHTDRQLVEVASLSVIGQLDLGGNDMIIHNGNLGSITALLGSGYAGGSWNGTGIASAAAHGDTAHLTALGSMQSMGNSFDGVATSTSDVLIKYTYYGDTNLDGKIDGTDYSRIDVGYLTAATGWANGDFNYDNHIDGSDYTLIDNAFNSQAAPL